MAALDGLEHDDQLCDELHNMKATPRCTHSVPCNAPELPASRRLVDGRRLAGDVELGARDRNVPARGQADDIDGAGIFR